MKKNDFLKELQEALEFENVTLSEDTNLKEIDGYDSLSVMTLIAFIDDHFGKKFTAQQLNSVTTVKSLIELIGLENIEN